jgi:hypothetical protein
MEFDFHDESGPGAPAFEIDLIWFSTVTLRPGKMQIESGLLAARGAT